MRVGTNVEINRTWGSTKTDAGVHVGGQRYRPHTNTPPPTRVRPESTGPAAAESRPQTESFETAACQFGQRSGVSHVVKMGRVFCEEPRGEWADPAGLRVTEWELYVAELVAKDVKERQVARWHDAEDGDVNLNSSQIVPYAPFSIWQMIYDWKRLRAALPVDGPIEIPDENVRVYLSLSLSALLATAVFTPVPHCDRADSHRLRILGRHDALLLRAGLPPVAAHVR